MIDQVKKRITELEGQQQSDEERLIRESNSCCGDDTETGRERDADALDEAEIRLQVRHFIGTDEKLPRSAQARGICIGSLAKGTNAFGPLHTATLGPEE